LSRLYSVDDGLSNQDGPIEETSITGHSKVGLTETARDAAAPAFGALGL